MNAAFSRPLAWWLWSSCGSLLAGSLFAVPLVEMAQRSYAHRVTSLPDRNAPHANRVGAIGESARVELDCRGLGICSDLGPSGCTQVVLHHEPYGITRGRRIGPGRQDAAAQLHHRRHGP